MRIDRLPWLLAAIVVLLALGALAHALVTSVRHNRDQLAILKALGFTRRQVSAAVAFQATLVGVLAVLLGVPLGLLAGSWGWEAVTTHLGLSPARPTVFVSCIVAAAATILAANVVAFGPGWRAGRLRPATLLRTE